MVWEGDNVVATGRKILGATKPMDSNPGTIRGNLCIDVGRNICHGSDSVESANNEIKLWFKPEELLPWGSHGYSWTYEVPIAELASADKSIVNPKAAVQGSTLKAHEAYAKA